MNKEDKQLLNLLGKIQTLLIILILMFIGVQSVFAEAEHSGYLSKTLVQAPKDNILVARKYLLGPNDVISLSIMNIPELNQIDIKVQPDGKINLLYLNNLDVAGLSLDELQKLIKDKYSDILVDPQISVKLVQSRPFIVYVSGAVLNPGSYELNTITNTSIYYPQVDSFIERKTPLLSNIITAAGGVKYDADYEHVKITNEYDGTNREINLLKMISFADSSQDVYLMAGDRVYVPVLSSPMAINPDNYKILITSTIFQKEIPVKVIGYVNKPGLVSLNSSKSANLNSAIAAAGGYLTDSAYIPKKVYLSRNSNNNKIVTKSFNPMTNDIVLMPNDIIYVPDKFRSQFGKCFDYVSRLIYPVAMYSNIRYNFKYAY